MVGLYYQISTPVELHDRGFLSCATNGDRPSIAYQSSSQSLTVRSAEHLSLEMDAKEGLRARIYKCLDRMGPYHIFLLSAFITFSLTAGYSNSVNVFYTFTPGYHCGVAEDPDNIKWNECPSGGGQSEESCKFDESEKWDSIVTEYNLICSKRYLAALSSTIYFAGVTIGALIFGPLSDYIGRRRTLQITTIGHILMGICIHFDALTPTVAAFITLRFIQGAWNQGMQTIAYTSLIELTPVRYRTLMGCIWEACWSLGMIYVTVISSFTYQWRILQLYMLIPTALGVIATFIIPESMHWHWTRNNFKAIISSYTRIARKNGDEEFERDEKEFQQDKDWSKVREICEEKDKLSDENQMSTLTVLKTIFKSPILRKHLLVMALFWFTVTVTYYAITFFVPNLGGNRHQNIMIGGGVEVAGYVVLYLAMQRFGRSRVLGIFAILSAALCIVFAIIEFVEIADSDTKGEFAHNPLTSH